MIYDLQRDQLIRLLVAPSGETRAVAFTSTGQLLTGGVDGIVHALVTLDGQLFAAGEFSGHIVRWDWDDGWQQLGSGVEGNVYSLASVSDKLIVGGDFEVAGGISSANVAQWVDGIACCDGIRGDINGDGADLNIVDLTCIVDYLFGSGCEMPCPSEADVNGDAAAGNIVDLTFFVDWLFGVTPELVPCQ